MLVAERGAATTRTLGATATVKLEATKRKAEFGRELPPEVYAANEAVVAGRAVTQQTKVLPPALIAFPTGARPYVEHLQARSTVRYLRWQ